MSNTHAELIAQLKRYDACETDWINARAMIAALSAPVTLAQAMQCPEVQAMVDASRRTVAHYAIVHKGPVGMRTTGMALMDELAATIAPILALSANNPAPEKDAADGT